MGDGWKPNAAVHRVMTGVFLHWVKAEKLRDLKLIRLILKELPCPMSIQAVYLENATDAQLIPQSMFWSYLLEAQPMQMDHIHEYE